MGNLVSADVEGGYKRLCEELLANDGTKYKSGCFHWASPPLKKEQLDHFKECLGKNNCLKRLVLKDLDTLDDCPSLAQVIQKHPALTCLSFNGRLPKEGFEVFVNAFLQSATLQELEIENSIVPTNIVDGVISVLNNQDKSNGSITRLSLKGCQMTPEELNRLTKALQETSKVTATTLKILEITLKPPIVAVDTAKNLELFFDATDSVLEDIKFAGFLENDTLSNLLEGVKGHPSLKSLTLEGKGVKDEDSIESIAQLLMDAPSLTILNLSSCSLSAECGARLAKALQETKSAGLKELHLSHNMLADEGAIALGEALLMNNLHLGEESIRNNREFELDDAMALADMIVASKSLKTLHFEDASFDDEGFHKLLEGLMQNTTIKEWHAVCFTKTSLQGVVAAIPKLHLQKIHIRAQGDAHLDAATGKQLLEVLGQNVKVGEFKITELKGAQTATWKSLEPKVQELLSKRNNGEAKRSMDGEAQQEPAKRAKNTEQ